MQRISLLLIFVINMFALHGQIPFSILPDVGGINRQAMGFIAIPDSADITIIGHRYDTILPGPNTKPYLAHFTYDGHIKSVFPIIDSLYAPPFNVSNNPMARKNDSIYYYLARRDIGGQYFTSYLIKLNINSGKVARSTLITNDQYPNISFPGNFVSIIGDTSVLLLNILQNDDAYNTYITILDTLLNIRKSIKINDIEKITLAQKCKMDPDGLFTVVGDCQISSGPLKGYFDLYLDKVDSTGKVLSHTLAPTTFPFTLGIADTRTILQDEKGNWIIGGLYFDDLSNTCSDCYQLIPYIFSATQNFDTLLWQTRFFDVPNTTTPQYFLRSMTQVEDGFIATADYESFDGSPFDQSGVLLKASLQGDSLWMKHYIPLGWDDERVAWVNFNDIHTSPYVTIVVAGSIGDKEENIIRPWILQLDKDGCLVPGCNTVATLDENVQPDQNNFSIYPNPVSAEIYLLSKITSSEQLSISIISNDGIEIKKRNFDPVSGYQYALPISDLPPGLYYLMVTNPKTSQVLSYKFIKQ
ncbi:MAG: T9SS type A sorting domain-containing protein [Saprospiraceae bacterium]